MSAYRPDHPVLAVTVDGSRTLLPKQRAETPAAALSRHREVVAASQAPSMSEDSSRALLPGINPGTGAERWVSAKHVCVLELVVREQ